MREMLIEAVKDRQVILFAGAGISAGLNVPTWREFIQHIGSELGYEGQVESMPSTNYLTLAEYYRIKMGSIGPLRSWMDNHWSVTPSQLAESRVHELLVSLDFPIIYTTNYDRNLENAFKLRGRKFAKIVDVRDIAKTTGGETQIIKLHGDFDDDRSIVLTETDYYDRLSFESPLDIKLRSDALARTVLFIGYSLSDINVRLLLHKLWRTWEASGHGQYRPKSYIFLSRPDEVQEAVLRRWNVEVLSAQDGEIGDALVSFLEDLKDGVGRL
jgi:hypothetical protein